jgi:oligopeptide transport system substrate-binding protein
MNEKFPSQTQRILLYTFIASLSVGILLSGCSKRESPVKIGNREQILHLGNGSDPQDLDPHTTTGIPESNIIKALTEGLVSIDPADLTPVPGAAESWDISDDKLTYTFHLRKSGVWSNGDPVTASDFVFSFQRILSPALGCAYAYMLFCIENGEKYYKEEITDFSMVGVKAIDDYTLRIKLRAPTPYFLSSIHHHSWFPVHPATVLKYGTIDQIGNAWTKPGNYVGNGPFTLQLWGYDKKIVVKKSDSYWDKAMVRLNEIHFYPIGDHKVEERSFRAGQLHVTSTIPLDRVPHYIDSKSPLLHIAPYLGTYYYAMNVNRPPFDNIKVRRALALAIDREKIVKYVTKGKEKPAYNFTPPETAGYTARAQIVGGPEEARKLLSEAGFPNGEGFPKTQLLYNTSDAHARLAAAIQHMWKTELNIHIELVNMEWKVFLATTQEKKYDISRQAWVGDYVDPNTFLDMWITGRGNNRAGYSNKKYDELLEKAATAMDQKERHEYFQEAEKLLLEEMPIIPVYFYVSKSLVKPSVKGWLPNVLDDHPYKHIHLEETD